MSNSFQNWSELVFELQIVAQFNNFFLNQLLPSSTMTASVLEVESRSSTPEIAAVSENIRSNACLEE